MLDDESPTSTNKIDCARGGEVGEMKVPHRLTKWIVRGEGRC